MTQNKGMSLCDAPEQKDVRLCWARTKEFPSVMTLNKMMFLCDDHERHPLHGIKTVRGNIIQLNLHFGSIYSNWTHTNINKWEKVVDNFFAFHTFENAYVNDFITVPKII